MRGYIAFVKKEFMENVRTYKLLILLAVFFIFGMMSPLLAKLTPEILKSMASEMQLTIPIPTALTSYEQYFKNVGQMGLFVIFIIFGSTLTSEYTKGTLINVLTKGLSRKAIIFAKYTTASILWTLSILLSLVTTYGYTIYLFPKDKVYHLVTSVGSMWIFGLFLLAIIIFASTLVKSGSSCMFFTATIIGFLFIINIFPSVKSFNPLFLSSNNTLMMVETYDFSNMLKSLVVTLVAIVVLIGSAVVIFDKKQI